MDNANAFTTVNFSHHTNKSDIFLKMLSFEFVFKIFAEKQSEHPEKFRYGNGRSINVSIDKLFKYIAIRVRVQGLQNKPTESKSIRDPQRKAFQEAINYFKTKYPNIDCIGIAVIEVFHREFYFSSQNEKELSVSLCSIVKTLGELVVGDEKLFHFTGNSGWIRLCPKKPDRIGLWHYELCAKLSTGKSILIAGKCHKSNMYPLMNLYHVMKLFLNGEILFIHLETKIHY
jgi:hypothetical protein